MRSASRACRSCFTTSTHFSNTSDVTLTEAGVLQREGEGKMKKLSKRRASMVLLIALLVTGAATTARAQERRVTGDVPFDFIVQGMLFPAGDYVIAERPEGILSIASEDGRYFAFVLSTASDAKTLRPELVFDRVEGRYYFAGFVLPDGTGREVPVVPTSIERERVAVVLNR
jgi:hypothetical protein